MSRNKQEGAVAHLRANQLVLSHVLASNLKNYNSQISGVMKP